MFRQRLRKPQIFVLVRHVVLRIGAQMFDEGLTAIEPGLGSDLFHFSTDARDFGKSQLVDFLRRHVGRGVALDLIGVVLRPALGGEDAGRALAAIGGVFLGVEGEELLIGGHHRSG